MQRLGFRLGFRLALVTGFCALLGWSQAGSGAKIAVVTPKGVLAKEDTPDLTIGNVTLRPGETLLVSCNDEGGDATVTWKGIALHQDVQAGGSSGSFFTAIFSLYSATGGTGDLVAQHDSAQDLAINAYSVTGLAAGPVDKTGGDQGEGTSPSSGPTATTSAAHEFVWGSIGYSYNKEATGTWKDGFTPGGQIKTTGGIGGVEDGYKTVSATGAYTAAKAGTSKDSWNAVIATYAMGAEGSGSH